ncbi:MAG: hypothetical protein RIS73_1062 [Bacteroidota bacterium]
MKIFLDPQIFYAQKFGGISRIFAEFWIRCNERDDVEIICPLFFSENLHLRENNLHPKRFTFLFDKNYPGKKYVNAVLKRINRQKTYFFLQKNNYDLFICTYYNPYFLNKLHNKPFVLTVFDMIHEIFPSYFSGEEALKKNKKLLCETSSKIVAISASTKKDILNLYPLIPAEKVNIIHLSQSINTKETLRLSWLPEKYVLFIGKRELYKQFDCLLKAMIPVFESDKTIKIVCAGGGALTNGEAETIKSLNLSDRIIQRSFYDNELNTIYKNAALFIFPSEYEGFGIPALEAMVCGCPVILSNTSSLPEIAADAALYFEPNNVTELSAAILKILQDEHFKNSLIEKGYNQVKKFSWDKMTNEYLDAAKEILNLTK